MSRVFILDPAFCQLAGHFASANRALVSLLGMPITLYVSAQLQEPYEVANCRVVRHFSYSRADIEAMEAARASAQQAIMKDALSSKLRRRIRRALKPVSRQVTAAFERELVTDFCRFFEAEDIQPDDHVIIHSLELYAAAFAGAMEKLPRERRPVVHLRILNGKYVRRDNQAYIALDRLMDEANIHLYTEIRYLARWLRPWFPGRRFDLLRLPLYPAAMSVRETPLQAGSFRILFFGSVRHNKGWDRLAPILRELRLRDPATDWQMIMHVSNPARLEQPKYEDAVCEAREAGVRIVTKYVSDEESSAMFGEADLVLLPYSPHGAALVGSGVAFDAITHGVPLLVSAHCAHEEFVESGNGIAAASNTDFVEAILRIKADYTTFRRNAGRLAAASRGWFEESRLRQRILGRESSEMPAKAGTGR